MRLKKRRSDGATGRRRGGVSLAGFGIVVLLLMPAFCLAESPTIDELLRGVGVEPREVGIHETDLALMVGMRPRSPLSQLLMTEPLRADAMARVIGQLLANSAASKPVDTLSTLSRFTGRTVRRGLVGDPLERLRETAKSDGAFAEALRRCGARRVSPDEMAAVPPTVREATTLLLLAMLDAQPWIERATASVGDERWWARLERELRKPLPESTADDDDAELGADYQLQYKLNAERFAGQYMLVAAEDLTLAAIAAQEILDTDESLKTAEFDLRVNTRIGWIALSGHGDHEHVYRGPVALILDLGGDDTYGQAGANGDRKHAISIALDLAGNDLYQASADALGSFGTGVLGVGLLWDRAGNDVYDADRRSQGCGVFGVGILIDEDGSDTYRAVADSQAHATAGYAMLIDRAGDDRYSAYISSQAFAGPNSAATLVDLAGNDEYIANDTDIRFPSPQNAEHNVSMCQGAATGERADYLDGFSINGGVAVLLDAAGDDSYTCGVFGQGVGYWYGTGMLIDLDGRDRYTGHWYVQGASAHFAAGILVDRNGDDRYLARQNMSQGAGHDVGIGVFVDDAGDDEYDASTLGLGASNAAGVGIFIDKAGDDTYRTPATRCLGWVSRNTAYRGLFRSYGLFFDLAGRDEYAGLADAAGRPGPANDETWLSPRDDNAIIPYQFGFGFDASR